MKITQDVRYIGVSDHDLDLFEGQYEVPDGMAYNSYVILDEKIAVFDTVDKKFGDEWLENLKNELNGRTPDYLVVLHMCPDHSANIAKFAGVYKDAKIVSSAAAFRMMKAYFGDEFTDRRIVVKEGDKLNLGKHELTFVGAPMVHWPEVIVAYESSEKLLFSADAFGKFGAFDVKADWACEARRYYFGIVGKYGVQAQNLLKKAAALDIEKILPLHGPLLTENLGYYLGLYNTWSSYGIESEGVTIAYTSVYGHTERAVRMLKEEIEKAGVKVAVHDLARCDESEAVEDAFRYGKLVLATTTYNASIFPFMQNFINALTERNYKNRRIGLIENGSWAPTAAKIMRAAFEKSENIEFCPTTVKIVGAVSEENVGQIKTMAKEIIG